MVHVASLKEIAAAGSHGTSTMPSTAVE